MIRTLLFTLVLLGLFSTSAFAQFAGDVFFEDPSVAAPRGQQVILRVQTFTGSTVLGAAHLVLRFDPGSLAIDEVRAGKAAEFDELFVQTGVGEVTVLMMNGASLENPFGTVDLLEVVARPVASVGRDTEVTLEVISLLDEGSEPFAAAAGFAVQISVISPVSSTQANRTAEPTADDIAAAARLRRPGHTVVLMRGEWYGSFYIPVAVEVVVFDPSVLSD